MSKRITSIGELIQFLTSVNMLHESSNAAMVEISFNIYWQILHDVIHALEKSNNYKIEVEQSIRAKFAEIQKIDDELLRELVKLNGTLNSELIEKHIEVMKDLETNRPNLND